MCMMGFHSFSLLFFFRRLISLSHETWSQGRRFLQVRLFVQRLGPQWDAVTRTGCQVKLSVNIQGLQRMHLNYLITPVSSRSTAIYNCARGTLINVAGRFTFTEHIPVLQRSNPLDTHVEPCSNVCIDTGGMYISTFTQVQIWDTFPSSFHFYSTTSQRKPVINNASITSSICILIISQVDHTACF